MNDINTDFFKRFPEYREYAELRMEQERDALHNPHYSPLHNVSVLMGKFRYLPELVDYELDILIIFARDLQGDCDTAAILGEWALEEIGIPARRMNMKIPGGDHQICISNDNKVFITLNDVVEIKGHWGKFLYNYFKKGE